MLVTLISCNQSSIILSVIVNAYTTTDNIMEDYNTYIQRTDYGTTKLNDMMIN